MSKLELDATVPLASRAVTKSASNKEKSEELSGEQLRSHLHSTYKLLHQLESVQTPSIDLTAARSLANSNRALRQAALEEGHSSLSHFLSELESPLTTLANGPVTISGPNLTRIRQQLQTRRVMQRLELVEGDQPHGRLLDPSGFRSADLLKR